MNSVDQFWAATVFAMKFNLHKAIPHEKRNGSFVAESRVANPLRSHFTDTLEHQQDG